MTSLLSAPAPVNGAPPTAADEERGNLMRALLDCAARLECRGWLAGGPLGDGAGVLREMAAGLGTEGGGLWP